MLLKSDREQLEKIRTYIADNLSSALDIKTLSALFCLSVPTLRRRFQQHFQLPIYKYIHQQRMEYARDLVLGCDHTISEISELVGYSDQSNFSHAFTNYFGIAPSHFAGKNEPTAGDMK